MNSLKKHSGRIVSHQMEAPRYFRLMINAPEAARTARAGQFLHVLPGSLDSFDPLLRRAFSVLRVEGELLTILYRVEGKGTMLLSTRQVGERLDFLGPLGENFAPVPKRAILVGGGVGVPPMAMLARQTFLEETANRPYLTMLLGARNRDDVLCLADFSECEIEVKIATEDGSFGETGRVTKLLEHILSNEIGAPLSDKRATDVEFCPELIVYACGPLPMLRVVATMCARFNVLCQVSLEENMPCGVGVCNGCVVPVAKPENEYSIYKRICVDGPVMWAHDLSW